MAGKATKSWTYVQSEESPAVPSAANAPAPASTGTAAIACTNCRRLKMKCVGSDNPPCQRCAKAGRECIVQQSNRGQHMVVPRVSRARDDLLRDEEINTIRPIQRLSEPASGSIDRSGRSSDASRTLNHHDSARDSRLSYDGHQSRASWDEYPKSTPASLDRVRAGNQVLPSIYSTPSYTAINDQHEISDGRMDEALRLAKRRKTEPFSRPSGSPSTLYDVRTDDPLSERDMIQLIEIFRKRMYGFIPLISADDLEDINYLITKKRQLAHCICFVTAKFVPGVRQTRAKMVPTISAILSDKSFATKGDYEAEWTLLQGLSVLYAYRQTPAPPVNNQAGQADDAPVPQWPIKAFTESYATHVQVHRAVEGVRAAIRAGASAAAITSSHAYRKYLFWLWLFTMSHHYSVITGTPPSIREDSSIRIASDLLKDIGGGPRILQLLAEVELCMLWNNSSLKDRGLAEWWGPPPANAEANSDNTELLTAIGTALQAWTEKWMPFITDENFGPGIDFYYRFTRFCISSYFTRNLKLQSTHLTQHQSDAISQSVSEAANFYNLVLDMGPFSKEALRYMSDFGFVLLSFACLYVIQAVEVFENSITGLDEYLTTAGELGQLMKDLAFSGNSNPGIYGRAIIARINLVCDAKEAPNAAAVAGGKMPLAEPYQSEWILIDPLWDLTRMFPDA